MGKTLRHAANTPLKHSKKRVFRLVVPWKPKFCVNRVSENKLRWAFGHAEIFCLGQNSQNTLGQRNKAVFGILSSRFLGGERKRVVPEKCKGIALEPFIGRGSALNRAITHTLGTKAPQTTRQISKNITNIAEFKDTSCSTVNSRSKNLTSYFLLKT